MSEARRELEQIIARLECMSHVPALTQSPKAEVGGATTGDEKTPGGKRPRGGIDRKDDADREDVIVKSAEIYRHRLNLARSEIAVEVILGEARQTLRSWTHTPVRDQPIPTDPMFRRWVNQQIKAGKSQAEVARLTGVTRQRINQLVDVPAA